MFKRQDVQADAITQAQLERTGKTAVARNIPIDIFRRKVKAAWSIRPEDIVFVGDIKERLAHDAADYQKKFQFSGLLTNEFYKILLK